MAVDIGVTVFMDNCHCEHLSDGGTDGCHCEHLSDGGADGCHCEHLNDGETYEQLSLLTSEW